MNAYEFALAGSRLLARASGALFWPDQRLLVVSDLHLGKAERIARRGGSILPPYETRDTLSRLDAELSATQARSVICLGDSFDDLAAFDGLDDATVDWINRMMAGRVWTWIEGNHDPGPVDFGGTHVAERVIAPLTFRHIAQPGSVGEVSGHYHPKATLHMRGRSVTRACFLHDTQRVILPAFGTYTGGLRCTSAELQGLMQHEACAVLTGSTAHAIPMPRVAR